MGIIIQKITFNAKLKDVWNIWEISKKEFERMKTEIR